MLPCLEIPVHASDNHLIAFVNKTTYIAMYTNGKRYLVSKRVKQYTCNLYIYY